LADLQFVSDLARILRRNDFQVVEPEIADVIVTRRDASVLVVTPLSRRFLGVAAALPWPCDPRLVAGMIKGLVK